MELRDRVVLLTGVKRLGATVARELARGGAHIAVSYFRSRPEADALAADVRQLGRQALSIHANLASFAGCRALVAAAADHFGRLDALVNMASRYDRTPFDDLTEADWEAAVAIDLTAALACAQAAVPHLRRAGGGRIVNVADWVARSGRPRYRGYLPYFVAKAGVVALTEALALELARDNILVNRVAPGPILPPEGTSPSEIQAIADATPLGRWGGALEMAKAVKALLETDFVTGETLRVDGGRHLK